MRVPTERFAHCDVQLPSSIYQPFICRKPGLFCDFVFVPRTYGKIPEGTHCPYTELADEISIDIQRDFTTLSGCTFKSLYIGLRDIVPNSYTVLVKYVTKTAE